jgi:SAM-dependent MidA family methyltransferase
MEMALYYPETGYYTSPGEKTGIRGDYYTSPVLDSIFGTMIGKQVEEMWHLLSEPCFTIVEYGAGNGALCHDIMAYLQQNEELYNGLTYYIIEKSPVMIEAEKVVLERFANKIKWCQNIKEIGDITGCILSNEVADNFSVHQVIMQDELMEIFVGYDEKFIEVPRPAAEELKDYLRRFNIILPKNFRSEINLQAEDWIVEIAAALKKGFVLTIDYGYPAAELYHPKKSSGTMLCYHHHTINDDPFLYIGEQDITTHINFSALLHTGAREGLEYCGFTTQSYFLSGLGLTNHLRQAERDIGTKTANPQKMSSITTLMSMGQKFRVLIQQKGLKRVPLSGMQFPLQLE